LPHYRVAQLGKDGGGSPIGVLRELAQDDGFKGVVLCDTLTPFLVRQRWEDQRGLYASRATIGDCAQAIADAYFEDCLSIHSKKTGVATALKQVINTGLLPAPDPVRMRPDRTVVIDYAEVSGIEAHRIEGEANYRRLYDAATHPSPDDLMDEIVEIDGLVRRIRSRGGEVVFVSMPTSHGVRDVEREYHPKSSYWDRFASACSGVWIHSTDLPGADGVVCPDGSHLDSGGAIVFTNALIDELLVRKVVSSL
jgi:hypothetical protein